MSGLEVPKPDELLALDQATTELFDTFRRWFDVSESVSLDLTAIDSAVVELSDPVMVAALAMRKLQALNLLSTPGVRTSTDVVVAVINDLERAMIQAPTLRLRAQAQRQDWDSALAELTDPDDDTAAAPAESGGDEPIEDPEVEQFRAMHRRLHAAVRAVVEASDGEIRIFI